MTVASDMRMHQSVRDLVQFEDENTVVNGVVVIFDMTGLTLKHIANFNKDPKNTSKINQASLFDNFFYF